MDKLKPPALHKLRQVIARKLKQPPWRKANVKSPERQLEKQKHKLVVLDAAMVGPVQAEIRRLRREIEAVKRESRQQRRAILAAWRSWRWDG